MSYLQAYSKLLFDTRLLSKISSFLMMIFTVIEVIDFTRIWIKSGADRQWLYSNRLQISVYLGFVSLIALTFILRFGLLFRKNIKFILITQVLWLFAWLTIIGYQLVTNQLIHGSFFGQGDSFCVDCMYSDTFVGASTNLFLILSAYLFFSPIKQMFVLFYALAPCLKNKNL